MLNELEKELLRELICEKQPFGLRNVSPETLKKYAEMTDEEVRQVLIEYKQRKIEALQDLKAKKQLEIAKIDNDILELQV